MVRIFDSIDQELLSALCAILRVSRRLDFCVGYLNLRGWHSIDDLLKQTVGKAVMVNTLVYTSHHSAHLPSSALLLAV